jgi:hypothetical protein
MPSDVHPHPATSRRPRAVRSGTFCGGVLIAVLSQTAGTAAEFTLADVRMGLSMLPSEFSYRVTDNGRSTTGSTSFRSGFGIGALAAYAFSHPGDSGAFFIGAEAVAGRYAYESDGVYESADLRLIGGYGYAITDRWSVEAHPWIGGGYGRFSIPSAGLYQGLTVSGAEYQYGATLGSTFAFAHNWLAAGSAGWMESTAEQRGDGLELRMHQSGPCFFLGLAYRFDAAPPRIR